MARVGLLYTAEQILFIGAPLLKWIRLPDPCGSTLNSNVPPARNNFESVITDLTAVSVQS